jgi:NAD(P)-dependent dehydrogenase (short-subunit alcohol dehydrogenase family)
MEGVAVVTGGASGIGAACCRRSPPRAWRSRCSTSATGRAPSPPRSAGAPYSADVSDEAALSACAERIEAEMGRSRCW